MIEDETRTTIEMALEFTRDTLKEHAGTHIVDGEKVLAPEFERIEAALAWLRQQGEGHWQPLRADDPYFDDSPVWLDENGCVCWAGPDGETQRLVLYGDMRLCLFVPGEEQ